MLSRLTDLIWHGFPVPSPSDAPVARGRDGCHKIHTVVLLFSGSIVTFMYFLLLLLYFPLECNKCNARTIHTVSFDWFLSGLEWIIKFEFCLQNFLIFYQKLLENIRSRLNFSTFWVFEPVFGYIWSKLFKKLQSLIKNI